MKKPYHCSFTDHVLPYDEVFKMFVFENTFKPLVTNYKVKYIAASQNINVTIELKAFAIRCLKRQERFINKTFILFSMTWLF